MLPTSKTEYIILSKDLYLEAANGSLEIPKFNNSNNRSQNCESVDYWFLISALFLRSDYLRPHREPRRDCGNSQALPTISVHTIAETYLLNPCFNSAPILVHPEVISEKNRRILIVYEGRHRAIGAALAGRKYILGRLIDSEHPDVIYQHTPTSKTYFRMPLYPLAELAAMYKHNLDV